jgi:hypothetical protein
MDKTLTFNQLFGAEVLDRMEARETGYRVGFTHGVQTVIDLLGDRLDSRTLDAAGKIQEIAMKYRFGQEPHPLFADDLKAEFWQGSGNESL